MCESKRLKNMEKKLDKCEYHIAFYCDQRGRILVKHDHIVSNDFSSLLYYPLIGMFVVIKDKDFTSFFFLHCLKSRYD